MPNKPTAIYLSTNSILWLKELLERQLEYWNKQPAHYKWANINKREGTVVLKAIDNKAAQSVLDNWVDSGEMRSDLEIKQRQQTTKDHACFHKDYCGKTGKCYYTQKPPVESCKWTDLIGRISV